MNEVKQSQLNEIHVYENQGPDKQVTYLQIRHLLGKESTIVAELDQPSENELKSSLMDLKNNSVNPTKIYISTWSRLKDLFHEIWPKAQILLEYND
jgi:hypothetical protein